MTAHTMRDPRGEHGREARQVRLRRLRLARSRRLSGLEGDGGVVLGKGRGAEEPALHRVARLRHRRVGPRRCRNRSSNRSASPGSKIGRLDPDSARGLLDSLVGDEDRGPALGAAATMWSIRRRGRCRARGPRRRSGRATATGSGRERRPGTSRPGAEASPTRHGSALRKVAFVDGDRAPLAEVPVDDTREVRSVRARRACPAGPSGESTAKTPASCSSMRVRSAAEGGLGSESS